MDREKKCTQFSLFEIKSPKHKLINHISLDLMVHVKNMTNIVYLKSTEEYVPLYNLQNVET